MALMEVEVQAARLENSVCAARPVVGYCPLGPTRKGAVAVNLPRVPAARLSRRLRVFRAALASTRVRVFARAGTAFVAGSPLLLHFNLYSSARNERRFVLARWLPREYRSRPTFVTAAVLRPEFLSIGSSKNLGGGGAVIAALDPFSLAVFP